MGEPISKSSYFKGEGAWAHEYVGLMLVRRLLFQLNRTLFLFRKLQNTQNP